MNIGDYREKEVKYYVVANILLVLVFSSSLTDRLANSNDLSLIIDLIKVAVGSSIAGGIIYLYIFLISSLLSGEVKSRIAYFKIGHLPGSTIFSDLMIETKDMRFSQEKLRKKYKRIIDRLPSETNKRRKYENYEWNSIYNQYRNEPMVQASNRDYLVFRELTLITFPIMGGYFVCVFISGFVFFSWKMILFFALEIVITNIAMRKKAVRFTRNVIALDINNET